MKYVAMAAIAMAAHEAVVVAINVHDFPKTAFSCRDKNSGEYYADLELGCQVYHICAQGQFNRLTKMSFACPNGTLFSQSSRICNSKDNVYCPLSERYYDNVQGNIDTQGDYKTVFQVTDQPVFPLEPRRPARRPTAQEDDYEDEPSTAAPRRPSNRRQPSSRPTSTTPAPPTTPPQRQRPPQRQFQPQIPQQAPQQPSQFGQAPPQDIRPPAGNFLPPRPNTRNPPPSNQRPQLALAGVTPPPIEYAIPQRPNAIPAFLPGPPPPPPSTQSPPQGQNRVVVTRPSNLRRPNPLGATPSSTTTPAPSTTSTVDPNAEYEYYDYEEPADGQHQSNNNKQ